MAGWSTAAESNGTPEEVLMRRELFTTIKSFCTASARMNGASSKCTVQRSVIQPVRVKKQAALSPSGKCCFF